MGILSELGWRAGEEPRLHIKRRPARRESGAIGDPEDVGVDRDLRLTEHHVEDDAGGLAPHPGQRLERGAIAGHLAAVPLDELLA